MSSSNTALLSNGSIRFKRLRIGVLVLGVLVILAFASSSAYDAWRAYDNSLVATDRELHNVANALAEQTAWTWQAVDFLLRDTARWYQNDSHDIAPERSRRCSGEPYGGSAAGTLDYDCRRAGHSASPFARILTPHLDVSDRSYFIAQRDGVRRASS